MSHIEKLPDNPDLSIPPDGGVSLDFQEIVDELRSQISDLNYQNTLLRLSLKKMR